MSGEFLQRLSTVERMVQQLRLEVGGGLRHPRARLDWISFTPVWTNLTIGNATVICKYMVAGKWVGLYLSVTLGSSSSLTANTPSFVLPIAASGPAYWIASYGDTGTRDYLGLAGISAETLYLLNESVIGSYIQYAGVTSSVPFTWTTGDTIKTGGLYPIA